MRSKISKYFTVEKGFTPQSEKLTKNQSFLFWGVIVLSIIIRIIIIPYNMMDMGDSATRVWNALWWAQKPFFVLPESGHPFWFYFMGPLIWLTKEIYYTPIITMIVMMTIAGIYLFKITLYLSDFRTAMLTFFIFILNPVVFRLNFEPYSQQTYLAAICISIYYIIKAVTTENSVRYYFIAGIFAFIGLASRPEAIFVIIPLCFIVFMTQKKGKWSFIIPAIAFQVLWIIVSMIVYKSPLKTFQGADQYTENINIQGANPGLRVKGFFLPYYFLVLGLTFILFYYFVKGIYYSWKKYPHLIIIILFSPVIFPALVNGIASVKSVIYHTTHYTYLMFFFSPVFAAIGLNNYLVKLKSSASRIVLGSVIILSCIPLSYIKDFVPEKYNKLFPKVIQFIVTADEPAETKKLLAYIDENIDAYPSLIFDASDNASSILYVPYRTKLPPPDKVLISGYNIPNDKEATKDSINSFMERNPKGLIMFRKNKTLMNEIFTEAAERKDLSRGISKKSETDKWLIYSFGNE